MAGRAGDGAGPVRPQTGPLKPRSGAAGPEVRTSASSGELCLWAATTPGEHPRPCLGILGADWRGDPGPDADRTPRKENIFPTAASLGVGSGDGGWGAQEWLGPRRNPRLRTSHPRAWPERRGQVEPLLHPDSLYWVRCSRANGEHPLAHHFRGNPLVWVCAEGGSRWHARAGCGLSQLWLPVP